MVVLGNEGSSVTTSTTFSDLGSAGTYVANVDFGDGTSTDANVVFVNGVGTVDASHIYADNGIYDVTFSLVDPDNNSVTVSTTAEIANVAPTLVVASSQTIEVGEILSLTVGNFSDPGFDRPAAGTSESFEVVIDWGDGNSATPVATIVPGSAGVDTTGSINAAHTYTTPGNYTVSVTVTDDDGGTTTETFDVTVNELVTDVGVWLPTLDFETDATGNELFAGDVIIEQFALWGVHITTHDPINHPAMIFDSANPTGGDNDLATTDQENILIISEDADSSDPDDLAAGGTLIFDFDNPVMLDDIGLLDIDSNETTVIRLFDADGELIAQHDVNGAGDSTAQTVDLSATQVSRLEVEFEASGAITFVEFGRDGHSPVSVENPDSVEAGEPFTLDLNAGDLDVAQWVINWGDGNVETTTNASIDHVYDLGGTYEIVATAFSANGSVYVANTSVEVNGTESVALPTINFDRSSAGLALAAGDVVSDQFASLGVHITTDDPVNHPALIFDSANPTGGDFDLATNNQSNVLIISEDADTSDPDDNISGGTLIFTFDQLVTIDEIGLLDIDQRPATITLYDANGDEIQTTHVAGQGNNSQQTVVLDAEGVARMEIVLLGSGAVTEIVFDRNSGSIDAAPAKFVVAEGSTDDVYRYTAGGQQIDGFEIRSTATSRGVTTTTDGSTAWVVKSNEFVYVYGSDGTYQGEWDAIGPRRARGIATNDTDIWIVDDRLDRVYFYADAASYRSGAHRATSTFNLNNFNDDPSGIEVHGDTLWVTDLRRDQVFVYSTDGNYLGKWNLDSGNGRPSGIATDSRGVDLWVTDYDDGQIYYYPGAASRLSGSQSAASRITLPGNNRNPEGIADPVTPINLEEVVQGTRSAGEQIEYSFDATAGQQLYFDALSGSFSTGWSLVSPSGSTVFNSNNFSDIGTTVLQESGTYTLTVGRTNSNSTGNFSFQLREVPQNPPTSITLDQVVTAQRTTPGEQTVFTFDAESGEAVFFDVQSGSRSNGWSLISPSGDTVFNSVNFSDVGTTVLQESGTYVLTVGRTNTSTTGNFSFQLLDVPQNPPTSIVLDQVVTAQRTTPGELSRFTFDVVAGEEVFFNRLSGSPFLGWSLVSPSGETVFNNGNFSTVRNTILDETGTYVLTVGRPSSVTVGDFSFEIIDVPLPDVNPLIIDEVIAGNLESVASEDHWEFEGVPGEVLFFDLQSQRGRDLTVQLFNPDGDLVASARNIGAAILDLGSVEIDAPGTWSLRISGDPGQYTFQVWDVAPPESFAIEPGVIYNEEIETPGQRDTWTFDGTAGSNVFLDLQGIFENETRERQSLGYQLFAPDGTVLLRRGDFIVQALNFQLELPQTGTYTLEFFGDGDNYPGYQFQFNEVTPVATTAIAVNDVISSSLDFAGQEKNYTFTADAGSELTLDVLYNEFVTIRGRSVGFSIISPSGATIVDNVSANTGFIAPETGEYVLNVDDRAGNNFRLSDTIGLFSFRVLDDATIPIPDAANLAISNVVADRVVVGGSAEFNVSWTVTNNGSGVAQATDGGPWIDRVFFSATPEANAIFERVFAEVPRSDALAPGESYVQTATITLPDDFDGSFWVFVETDALNSVYETDPLNDNRARSESFSSVYSSERPVGESLAINFLPEDGSRFPAGTSLPLSGSVEQNQSVNVIIALDVSTSLLEPNGLDANGDGVVDQNDDINNFPNVGDVLDVSIAASQNLIEQYRQLGGDVSVGTIIFAGGSAPADLGPELFNQQFVDISTDTTFRGDVSNFDTAIVSVWNQGVNTSRQGISAFRSLEVAGGTLFAPAVGDIGELIATAPPADRTVVYFLTDGGGVDAERVNVEGVADQGIEFYGIQIGNNDVLDPLGDLVADVDADPSSTGFAISVADPTELSESLISTIQIESITINGAPVDALDPLGNFFSTVTLAPGPNVFDVVVTTEAGRVTESSITLFGEESVVFDINSADPIGQIEASFTATTFNRYENQLHVGFAATNEDNFAYATDIGAVFEFDTNAVGFTDASVDGITDAGEEFLILDSAIDDGILSPEETSDFVSVVIDNPLRERFAVDVDFRVTPNEAPVITSTPIFVAPSNTAYQYEVSAVDFNGDRVSFEIISAPASLTLTDGNGTAILNWTPTIEDIGNHQISILASDGRGGETLHSFDLLVPSNLENQAPLITSSLAPSERVATLDEIFGYDIEALDPEGDLVTLTLGEGTPAGVSIIGNQLIWTPRISDLGSVSIPIIASDPQGATSTQVINLNVLNANTAPVFVSQPITDAVAGGQYTAFVLATDPDDRIEYSLVNAPQGARIDSRSGFLTWSPEIGDANQAFDILIRATDARGLFAEQSFTVTVAQDDQAPEVSIFVSSSLSDGTNAVAEIGETATVTVFVNDNAGVDNVVVTVDGQTVALDSENQFDFTATDSGLAVIETTATDVSGNASVTTQLIRVIDPTDTEGPFVQINSPAINSQVTYLTDVAITVTGDDLFEWRLEYALKDTNNWVLFASGNEVFNNEVAGTFDPTLLQNDQYDIRLSATDISGNLTTEQIFIGVEGQAKLGNYRLEFTDLTIPLAGIPIQITRQYDTLNANERGDFGFGWNLAFGEANIRETIPVSELELAGVPPLFGGNQGFFIGTRVYVTTPEGQRVGFSFAPVPSATLLGTQWTPRFTADVDTDYELEVPNIGLSQNEDGSFGLYLLSGFAYNPTEYTLVSQDQIRYTYDQFDELQTITDRNDVTLEYRDDGIFSSTGESIEFVRDDQGRIVEIIDPAGNSLTYQYDAAGDLIAYTDQVDNTTTYQYDDQRAHFLDRIVGPRGNLLSEVVYDEDGRFVSVVDAFGNAVQQEYDLENNTCYGLI